MLEHRTLLGGWVGAAGHAYVAQDFLQSFADKNLAARPRVLKCRAEYRPDRHAVRRTAAERR